MNTTQTVFAILAAFAFVIPFFFWGFIRFLDKQTRTAVNWHKTAKIIVFISCLVLFILFIILAIFL
ncbi:hypothetical protein ESOMN_v1c05390 [Williamsoniiplasma somnilux]|uniref:Uncharacterized protein n=1 Tax=Williamsoniiplasma somnilux TaxID=215578 RepID=A0A2K8P1N3_9MOLU|nr:hypothetical protein [Williamsoniiplasma somnilux]ATZ18921.1 hypothetical protein ESOMN_v1c05390 [Williamsoniiplasma somnilux]